MVMAMALASCVSGLNYGCGYCFGKFVSLAVYFNLKICNNTEVRKCLRHKVLAHCELNCQSRIFISCKPKANEVHYVKINLCEILNSLSN